MNGITPIYLTLLNNGNLVIHSGDIYTGVLLWGPSFTGKTCHKGCLLSFQGDGNVVIKVLCGQLVSVLRVRSYCSTPSLLFYKFTVLMLLFGTRN